MAGIRVTAVAYRGLFDPGFTKGEPAVKWYFVALVTDTDGKPIVKLKQDNFAVRVHARGANGPVVPTSLSDCLDESVTLDACWEAPATSGVYVVRAQPPNQEGKTPDPAYVFADNSYVFSVSVVIRRSISRTLVAFGPGLPQFGPQANAEFIGTSV
jgi:hypothetical protein